MKVFYRPKYGENCYSVAGYDDWYEIQRWMDLHLVEYVLESSGLGEYIFTVTKNIEWFSLKWAD
jgi:hypothetical protein